MRLKSSVQEIKGIGEKTAKLFAKTGVYTVGDILLHFPRTYHQYPGVQSPQETLAEEESAVTGILKTPPLVRRGRRMDITVATAFCGDMSVELVWYRMPYLKSQLKAYTPYIFYGKLLTEGKRCRMEQCSVYEPAQYQRLTMSLQPIYPLTKGLTNQAVRKAVRQALTDAEFPEGLLPEEICRREQFLCEKDAYAGVHFPKDLDQLVKARERLVYQEFFYFILCSRLQKSHQTAVENHWDFPEQNVRGIVEQVEECLPYKLTKGQKEALEQIRSDMRGPCVSQRLIQGDVGSGKTIVAFLAMLDAVSAGYQAAIMAPTEVLARQHAQAFSAMIKDHSLPYEVVCLTGSMSAAKRREVQGKIANSGGLFVVGTHALIQEKVDFFQLALVITDEQHRFGVRQRELLAKKGVHPHMVVMSATPIPRTLAMILYSNMHVSLIHELPAHRLPIKTCAIKEQKRESAYRFLKKEAALGHQAYIICPLVEASDKTDAENVTEYEKKLREFLPPEIFVGVLHGKMKPSEKNRIMEEFAGGKIQILVSTTVVEVGINVPNATVIMIENANRFGLAALHQLRGRVGRGSTQSYCILMDDTKGEKISKRLEILNQSNDGFYIAEQDMKLRGPGDLFGIRQSGEFHFRIADIIQDAELLKKAASDVDQILQKDPECEALPQIRAYARTFMEQNTYIL